MINFLSFWCLPGDTRVCEVPWILDPTSHDRGAWGTGMEPPGLPSKSEWLFTVSNHPAFTASCPVPIAVQWWQRVSQGQGEWCTQLAYFIYCWLCHLMWLDIDRRIWGCSEEIDNVGISYIEACKMETLSAYFVCHYHVNVVVWDL